MYCKLLIFISIVLFAFYWNYKSTITTTSHLEKFNGQLINKRFENKTKASQTLQELQQLIDSKLVPYYPTLKNIVLMESPYDNSDDSSYTIDKQYVYMCLRDPSNPNKIYNLEVLVHVLLHELAHVVNNSYGHNQDFQSKFTELQNIFYTSTPMKRANLGTAYCGVIL